MATVNMTKGGTTTTGRAALYGKPRATVYFILDLPSVVTTKGSALAQDDVIQCIGIPKNTPINGVWVKRIEKANSTITTLNVDIGFGGDADLFVDGQAFTTTLDSIMTPTAGAFAGSTDKYAATFDTIDVTIMTFTGTAPTTGQLAIFANLTDLTAQAGSNIADVQ